MWKSSISLEDIQHLATELQHLVRAGMPLESRLAGLGSGHAAKLQEFSAQISSELNQGQNLVDIVNSRRSGAPRMLTAAIGAGIRSGDTALTIELMGDFAADVLELRKTVMSAAAYPLTIVAVAGLLVILVLQHSLEQILDVIQSWNMAVPGVLMQLLIWNRDLPQWTLVFPAIAVGLITMWFFSGRASAMAFRGPEKIFLLLPGVGGLVRDLQTYTLARMLTILTERSLPLDESLALAGGVSGSRPLQEGCALAAAQVRQGTELRTSPGHSLMRRKLPPLLMACLMQTEHQEQRLTYRLQSVADFYRRRMQRNAVWVRLILPVILFLVVGGGCVLTYALMLFWPISEVYRNLGG